MDEFKPEDELKPDTSDRRPQRSRKTSSAPKVPVSRQHMMMGVGILVLLLIVIGIGSTLNSPDKKEDQRAGQTPATSGSGNDIDLSGSSSMSGQSGVQTPAGAPAPDAGSNTQTSSPQELSAPPIASAPTQAQPVQTPAGQQRIELPGDLNSALSSQQNQVDVAAQGADNTGSLPTAPATVAAGSRPAVTQSATQPAPHQNKPAATHKTAAKPVAKESAHKNTPARTASPVASAPASKASPSVSGGNYTLQLSSASRADTLNAWAKKQSLGSYHVYKTTRNGEPWYVLVSGSYATPADARRAVASLPADVRAKNPWVKPVSQVKKESTN